MTNCPINVQSLSAQTRYMATVLRNTWAHGGYCQFICQKLFVYSCTSQTSLCVYVYCSISVICGVCMKDVNTYRHVTTLTINAV